MPRGEAEQDQKLEGGSAAALQPSLWSTRAQAHRERTERRGHSAVGGALPVPQPCLLAAGWLTDAAVMIKLLRFNQRVCLNLREVDVTISVYM